MELQEENESVSTNEDADNVILRGNSAVHRPSDLSATSVRPSSDLSATSVCPPPDFAVTSVRPPTGDTATAGFKGGSEVRPPVDRKRPSVNRSKQLSKPSRNQF
jgi:hypothetical protein